MKKLILIILVFASCTVAEDIQVSPEIVVLVKKKNVFRYPDYRTVQLWQTRDGKITFYEELPQGDTGIDIGRFKEVFTKR